MNGVLSRLRSVLKRGIGRAADRLLPSIRDDLDRGANPSRAPKIRRAIVEARVHQAAREGDLSQLQSTLTTYWRDTDGTLFHTRRNDARFAYFRSHHEPVLDALVEIIGAPAAGFTRLVEIGCGDGRLLSHAAKRLPGLDAIVGLDVNAHAAQLARAASDDPRLAIHVADATDWLVENPTDGTAILTNGGVFEYVAPEALDRLIKAVSLNKPGAFACIEPIAPDHDIASDTASHVFGRERSFSHNYPARFRAAGLRIVASEVTQIEDVRWLTTVARTPISQEPS